MKPAVCEHERVSRQDVGAVDQRHVVEVAARALDGAAHPRKRLATGDAGKRRRVVLLRAPERREHVDGGRRKELAKALEVGGRIAANLLARALAAPVVGPVCHGDGRGGLVAECLHARQRALVEDVAADGLVHQVKAQLGREKRGIREGRATDDKALRDGVAEGEKVPAAWRRRGRAVGGEPAHGHRHDERQVDAHLGGHVLGVVKAHGDAAVAHRDGMGLPTANNDVDAVDKAVLRLAEFSKAAHDLSVQRVRRVKGSRHATVEGDLVARGHKREADARGRARPATAANGLQVAQLLLREAIGLDQPVSRVLDDKGAAQVVDDVPGLELVGERGGGPVIMVRSRSRPYARGGKRRARQPSRPDEPCPVVLAQCHGLVPLAML